MPGGDGLTANSRRERIVWTADSDHDPKCTGCHECTMPTRLPRLTGDEPMTPELEAWVRAQREEP